MVEQPPAHPRRGSPARWVVLMAKKALISWGRSFDKTYLVLPVDKVGIVMDALSQGEIVVCDKYRASEKDAKFEPDTYGTDFSVCIIDEEQLKSPEPEPEEETAPADPPEPTSDLEQRIAECKTGDPPSELS